MEIFSQIEVQPPSKIKEVNLNSIEDYIKYLRRVLELELPDLNAQDIDRIINKLEEYVNDQQYDYEGLKYNIEGDEQKNDIAEHLAEECSDLVEYGQILHLLRQGFKGTGYSPFDAKSILLDLSESDKEEARARFRKLCPSIFTMQQNNSRKIGDLAILKAIDIKNGNHGLIILLWDTFHRYKIEKQDDIDGYFDVPKFWNEHYLFAKWLKREKRKRHKEVDSMMMGLVAFGKRVTQGSGSIFNTIYDRLDAFVDYTIAFTGFVYYILNSAREIFQEDAKLPLLFDFWIIPQASGKYEPISMDNTRDEEDDDDDSEDDVENETGNEDEPYNYMGFGGTDSSTNAPMFSIGDIGEYLDRHEYKQNEDYVLDETNTGALEIKPGEIIKARLRFVTLYKLITKNKPKASRRYVFVIDRRNPTHYVHPNVDNGNKKETNKKNRSGLRYTLDDDKKIWSDKIYVIKLKNNEVTYDPSFPEIMFELSRKEILPKMKETREPIGITNTLNGYMWNLSYHIWSSDMQRCYFTRNNEIRRFFAKTDMNSLWPKYFVKEEDYLQTFDQESLNSTVLKELKDEEFKKFYNGTVYGSSTKNESVH